MINNTSKENILISSLGACYKISVYWTVNQLHFFQYQCSVQNLQKWEEFRQIMLLANISHNILCCFHPMMFIACAKESLSYYHI